MRFRGITDDGEVIEFKNFCSDSDNIIEYGSEIGVHQGIWHYVKKDTVVCLELETLERKLAEYMELIKAVAHIGIDWGYGKFELKQDHIDKARKLYEAHEQSKEQG